MKIVIAPDSFKESLEAVEVAKAIAQGVLEVCPASQIDICPMADGGEGTVDAMVAATEGTFHTADVYDPLGAPIRAKFGMIAKGSHNALLPGTVAVEAMQAVADGETGYSGKTAIIEMAAASGIGLVPSEKRDPMRATTFGTGQLLRAAIDSGAKDIVIGIGGSCSNDGGVGCAQALGVEFYDKSGELIAPGMGGQDVELISRIEMKNIDERLAGVRIHVACDVTNTLFGPQGAAAVFGPQKGATEIMVDQLDKNMMHLAELVKDQLGKDLADMPGAGAAGGLGFGLVAFAGATLENGGKLVAQSVGLEHRLKDADLCITGEGKIDSQSRFGKVPVRVANVAGKAGVSTACIGGMVTQDAPRDLFCATLALVEDDITTQYAMANAAELLKLRAARLMKQLQPTQ